jgi:hypothetical protein
MVSVKPASLPRSAPRASASRVLVSPPIRSLHIFPRSMLKCCLLPHSAATIFSTALRNATMAIPAISMAAPATVSTSAARAGIASFNPCLANSASPASKTCFRAPKAVAISSSRAAMESRTPAKRAIRDCRTPISRALSADPTALSPAVETASSTLASNATTATVSPVIAVMPSAVWKEREQTKPSPPPSLICRSRLLLPKVCPSRRPRAISPRCPRPPIPAPKRFS